MLPAFRNRSRLTFPSLGLAACAVVLGALPARAVDYSFGAVTENFSIPASDRARTIGLGVSSGSFNDNEVGSVYDRGADRDATYLYFDLSPLAGTTIHGDVHLNFTVDDYWGGTINNGIIGKPSAAWNYPGDAPGVATFTPVAAPNRVYTNGETATWTIGNSTISGIVGALANFHGLAVTAGAGSTAHFTGGPVTLTGNHTTGAIRITGGTDWSAASWDEPSQTLAIPGSSNVSGGNVSLAPGTTLSVTDAATLGGGMFAGSIKNDGTLACGSSANQTLGSAISGSGTLAKSGSGTLALTATNTYSGGTTVHGGTLLLDGGAGGNTRIRGSLTVNQGATVSFANDDGTGLGFNNGAKVDALQVTGGTVTSPGIMHVWNLTADLTGGVLQSNNGTSTASGPQLEWGGVTFNTHASDTPSILAGRIRFRSDFGGIHSFHVADGPAAHDLLVSAALTGSGRNGMVKTGPGTMTLTGEVLIGGVITVEDGTLDLTSATLGPDLQINVANGARLRLSAVSSNKVFVAGQKLNAGTWGPPGSVATGTAQFESPVFTGGAVVTLTNTEPSARDRWLSSPYGLFVHYVFEGGYVTRQMDGSPSPSLDFVANNFDAQGFADDVASMGVDYVVFTAWHSNFIPLFNSSAVVNNFGFQRNSSRDMIGDMVNAVRAKGIRVLLYANIGQVSVTYDQRWNDVMEDIFAEMLDRYDIDGFWLDENDPGGYMSWDFPRIARAIYQRKPDAVTVQNFYGNLYTWEGAVGESGPATRRSASTRCGRTVRPSPR